MFGFMIVAEGSNNYSLLFLSIYLFFLVDTSMLVIWLWRHTGKGHRR